jgi:hypothetical protein
MEKGIVKENQLIRWNGYDLMASFHSAGDSSVALSPLETEENLFDKRVFGRHYTGCVNACSSELRYADIGVQAHSDGET